MTGASFLDERLTETGATARRSQGFDRNGYRLVYTDEPTNGVQAREDRASAPT